MNRLKKVCLIASMILCFNINADAQRPDRLQVDSFMKNKLEMTDAQLTEMKKIREESFVKRAKMMEKAKEERRKFKLELDKIESEQDSKLKKILSEKQYYALKKIKAKGKHNKGKGHLKNGQREHGKKAHKHHRKFKENRDNENKLEKGRNRH
jgi:hypothetical protein